MMQENNTKYAKQQHNDMKQTRGKLQHQRIIIKRDITKDQFLAILGKACEPISKETAVDEHVPASSEPSESDRPDGYNGKNTH